MPDVFDPRIEILPQAQKEIWPQLAPDLVTAMLPLSRKYEGRSVRDL